MISDEIKEQLSAYVDGELRPADATRVEKLLEGDERLRKEVEAYKKLGQKLRAWDRVENEVHPSPEMRARAMERAEAHLASGVVRRRRRLLPLARPFAAAAILLVTVGMGVLMAAMAPDQPREAGGIIAEIEVRPLEPISVAAVELAAEAPDPEIERARAELAAGLGCIAERLSDILEGQSLYVMHQGQLYTPRALEALLEWEGERETWDHRALIRDLEDRAKSTSVVAVPGKNLTLLVEAYIPVLAEIEEGSAVVTLRSEHPADSVPAFANAKLFPAGAEVGREGPANNGDTPEVLFTNKSQEPRMVLMGEIFASKGAVWVALADTWIGPNSIQIVPVLRIDASARRGRRGGDRAFGRLVAEGEIAGPLLRRYLARAAMQPENSNVTLRELVDEKQARKLSLAHGKAPTARQKLRRDRLVRHLRNEALAGFAVFAGTSLRGIEFFASHELMLECAPRLLLGYVREVDTKVRIQPLARVKAGLMEQVQEVIDQVADGGEGAELTKEGWPSGVRSVSLQATGPDRLRAHGLLMLSRPMHLTLLPE